MTVPSPRPSRRAIALVGGAMVLGLGAFDALKWWQGRAEGGPEPDDGRPAMQGIAPVLFIGHGSPMNVVQDNAFTRHLREWGRQLGRPRAIAMVSAHWLTEGQNAVAFSPAPPMIYDFGGFPADLYAQRYPAPGDPERAGLAAQAVGRITAPRAVLHDAARGLDHGAWTVLKHLYPAANVPVFQVSIDITRTGDHQLAVGRALAGLREQQVLIIGSGNVVHNLQATERGAPETPGGSTSWSDGFDRDVKAALDAHDLKALSWPEALSAHAGMAVPFPDHYWPLITAAGAAQSHERPRHVFEGFQAGTISMRCVQWG